MKQQKSFTLLSIMAAKIIRIGTALLGALIALLLARLVLQLFAARPNNAVFAAVRALTAPLIAPFAALDAGQPRFGAVLEFSTLALLMLLVGLLLAMLLVERMQQKRASEAQND